MAYRGPVDAVLFDLLGGLRSACTYIGAATIKEMPRRTTFIRVTQQLNLVRWSLHDIVIINIVEVEEGPYIAQ